MVLLKHYYAHSFSTLIFVVIRGVELVEASTSSTGLSLLALRSMPSNLEEL